MVDEMKDTVIKQQMDAYFDGAPLPQINLAPAKHEVRRRARRTAGRITAIVSSCAAVLLVAVLMWQLLPVRSGITQYSIADAVPMSATYTALREEYAETVAPFAPMTYASNASAEYSIYKLDGEAVLMCVELKLVGFGIQAQASVYVDLTNGAYQESNLKAYETLERSGRGGYHYETVEEGGEFVSKAYCTLSAGNACYVDMTTNRQVVLSQLMDLIRR